MDRCCSLHYLRMLTEHTTNRKYILQLCLPLQEESKVSIKSCLQLLVESMFYRNKTQED